MSTDLRPTAARLALLQAVADGKVTGARGWSTGKFEYDLFQDEGPRRGVTKAIEAMLDARWVAHGQPKGPSMYASRPIELTAAGRAVLDTRHHQGEPVNAPERTEQQ